MHGAFENGVDQRRRGRGFLWFLGFGGRSGRAGVVVGRRWIFVGGVFFGENSLVVSGFVGVFRDEFG